MGNLSKFACLALSATLLLNGCKGKDGDPGPAGATGATGAAGPVGPVGPNLVGSLVGFVNPYDEFGRSQAKSGVTVTVENTTPLITATTDANGRFELLNVKSGTYNIAYNKAGFGTYKVQGYPHAGGDQPAFLYSRELTGISLTTVSSITIGPVQSPNSNNGNDYAVPLTATLSNPNLPSQNNNLSGMVFVGNTSNVTSATGTQITNINYYVGQNSYPLYLSRSQLNQRGFATGTTAYAIVYGAPNYYYDYGYIDTTTGRNVYTSLSAMPSRVVPFVVP